MTRVVVYHAGYGCDTGCCGHYVDFEGLPRKFDFSQGTGSSRGAVPVLARLGSATGDVMTDNDRRPTPAAPGFVNDAVVGRFPKGTDPLAAVRETMSVFMERSDGTNALGWWQQCRWWHGSHGGFRKGRDTILPPSETGVMPHLPGTDAASVYITRKRADAVMYAAWHRNPMIYEVVIDVQPQPDDVLDDEDSFRVPSARIHRIESVSRDELRWAINQVLARGTDP